MKQLVLLLLLLPTFAHALEVDEKLTVRIVKTSETKKTVMLNRGTEDGLVEGDHAKFIVTAGIVARGVIVKVSPTRSVWSIYRLVNADFIVNDSVMSIKITPAVKITKDETQSLVQEDTPTTVASGEAPLGIPLADGAQDMNSSDSAIVNADLKALEDSSATPASIVERNKELYGLLNINALSASTKTDTGDESFKNSQSFMHFGLGAEYYPRREREWYSRFSLVGEVAIMKENAQGYNGAGVSNDLTELALGVNWHPLTLPSRSSEFIPFIHGTFNIGVVKSKYEQGANIGTPEEASASGSTNGFSIGAGYKFYTSKGFGARLMLDYYMRSEKYKEDDQQLTFNKKVAGPRLMVALGYRF